MKTVALILCLAIFVARAKVYKGAELRTKASYTYGRIEARFMPAEGKGIVASLFTYHEITSLDQWNEIDIEILGRYKDDVQLTTITPNQIGHSSHHYTSFNSHSGYHTYAFEWTPDYVAWFIDGKEVYRQTGIHIQTLNRPQKIMMNLWVSDGSTWVGDWDDRVLPKFSYYDWVSYSSYTPGFGNSGTDNNFTLQWRDDFDQFDGNRWQKATHSFNGNLVDFLPENIVYKNGKMILCLTRDTQTGFNDITPPSLLWARLQGDSILARFSEKIASGPAEQTSNYAAGTIGITSARLLADSQTVSLKVQTDSIGASTLVAFNMADLASSPNTQVYTLTDIITGQQLDLPVKINTGSVGASSGTLADKLWGPSVEYGHMDGYNQLVNNYNVYNPNMDVTYRNELSNVVKYKVRLAPGRYNISMEFSESVYQQPGKRLFDVYLEDSLVASQLDLQQLAGLHQPYTLSVTDFHIKDGILDIHFTEWTDKPLINAISIYQTPTVMEKGSGSIYPDKIEMLKNYPNPFNPATRIAYRLRSAGKVLIEIYNAQGKRIEKLVQKQQAPGYYVLNFNANGLASGIYFCRLTLRSGKSLFVKSRKMLLLQ
ncbi:MAG: glycosyl hydrolase family protein [Calditrichaeota bacterium]|nr:MAG: glycosyl hydrolase family protein [Calditrichota bacterium]